MIVTHEPWIVALSILVAIQGAYVGLSLTQELPSSTGGRRRLLLAGAAVTLAVAIWSMHFVGMLAVQSAVRIDYLVLPTLISFFACVFVVGLAVFLASSAPHSLAVLAVSATVMGAGIVAMHFIGMRALHANAMVHHDPAYAVASFLIGVAASGLAIYFTFIGPLRPPLVAASIALGVAISGMHYTAMAGVAFLPHANPSSNAPALSTDLLAIVVAIVAFVVSAIFLLTLVPDRSAVAADAPADEAPSLLPAWLPAWPNGTSVPAPASSAADKRSSNGADIGQGGYAPLGGAGLPPRRLARQLPVERDGGTHFVAVEQVVAVHANAHYTYIFDGTSKLFCPLAIGDVEARLDKSRFIRVHRSHIVNIDRVVGLKRAGDSGLVELAGADRYTVPVSRSRVSWLKSRLVPKVDQAVG